MKLSSVTFITAISVSLVNAIQQKVFPNGSQDLSRHEEHPEESWTWGLIGDPGQGNQERPQQVYVTTPPVDTNSRGDVDAIDDKANPCFRPRPVKPDFKAPGRSISAIKCYDYIWQIKYREAVAKNEKECKEYQKTHPNSGFIGTAAIGGRDAKPGEFPHMVRNAKTTKLFIADFSERLSQVAGDRRSGSFLRQRISLAIRSGNAASLLGSMSHLFYGDGLRPHGWKAIKGTWVFKCGGTLISENFVLTAAHCTVASDRDTDISDVKPKIVRFGDKNIIDVFANGIMPNDAYIDKTIVHPEYKSPMKYYDIALMQLEFGLAFNYNVQPACLWNSFDVSKLGKQAAVTGWGIFESGGRQTSPVLQVAVVDFIDSATCDRLLRPMSNRHWCGINDTQICAGKLAGGVDACQGDSGGPLSVRIPLPVSAEGAMHHVVGVTSFGFGCALEDTPGVYTRVSSFVPWIESIVWPS